MHRPEVFRPGTITIPVDFDPFNGPPIERTAPTTEAQREIWTAAQLGPEASCAYNESVSLELAGNLHPDALREALAQVALRHEAMRTVINASGTRNIVLDSVVLPLNEIDLAALSVKEQLVRLDELGQTDMTKAFDIQNGPLFRYTLVRLSHEKHLFRLTGHHLVCDGWSLGILLADISTMYSAILRGHSPELPPAFRYSDHALAQVDFLKSDTYTDVERYWLDQYEGATPRLDLPTDRPRPRLKTYAGDRFDAVLDPALVRSLRQVGTRAGSSLVITLLTAFEVLLHRLTGSSDLVVGLPAAGQNDMGTKELVGHCVNLLPLRSHLDPQRSFFEHLRQRRRAVLDAFDHQRYTFGTLLRKLKVPREAGRIPLVPVVFNIDMNMDDGVAFDGLSHRFISNPRVFENFELFLNASGNDQQLALEWSYNTDLFDRSTIEEWMDRFNGLLQRICAYPDRPMAELLREGTATSNQLLPPREWAWTTSDYPRDKSIGALFEEVAAKHPARIALQLGDTQLSYAELLTRVRSLSDRIRAEGIGPGEPVGLCVERTFDMITGMLAILHCGSAFVPFDPSYPAERLSFMFEDTQCRILLSQRTLEDALPAHTARVIFLEDAQPAGSPSAPQGTATSPAYIMYTSGSTGTPKGVVVPHRAVVRLVREQNFLPFGPEQVFLQLSNISFDASTLEIWGALLNGATLVLQPELRPTLQEIVEIIEKHQVSVVWFTAGLFNLIVDQHLDRLKGVRHVLAGGDVLSVPHVRKALKVLGPGVLINGYGPTENTTFTCCFAIDEDARIRNGVPVGKPLHNTSVQVLDEHLQPVPIGEPGELYTGGDGLSLGYWRRPELTNERFVHVPQASGEVLYRTGDLVRWSNDGAIEFIGRTDGQVKVRGFRIEPGEIETAISTHPHVLDRIVVARDEGGSEKQLVAYVVPRGAENLNAADADALAGELRSFLRAQLPEHMVPSAFVVLPALPLTANGKIDRTALPPPKQRSSHFAAHYTAPRTLVEEMLCAVWSKLLAAERVGVHDNFFDLGGHSLLGIQLLAEVEERTGRSISLKDFLSGPTVAGLAALIGEKDPPKDRWTNLTAIQGRGRRIPFFCVHGDEVNHFLPRHLGDDQPYYGFAHQGEDGKPIRHTTVEGIATHFINEMRSVRPRGPYLLGGYSFGGIVAFEMARQLTAAGDQVPLLILFDTYAPFTHRAAMEEDRKFLRPLKERVLRSSVSVLHALGRTLPAKLRHFHIIDTYDRATLAYRPTPYSGPVTVLRAEAAWGPEDKGWGELSRGTLSVRTIPGDHFTMVKEPAVNRLVEVAAECLERAQAGQAVEAV